MTRLIRGIVVKIPSRIGIANRLVAFPPFEEHSGMLPTRSAIELPLLKAIKQLGGRATPREVYPLVTAEFPQITEDERTERLEHGEVRWHTQIQWVRQRLVDQGEIESGGRGIWVITPKGEHRLGNSDIARESQSAFPTLLELHESYERSVRNQLRERLLGLTPDEFEHFAKRLLVAYGFTEVNVTGRSGDGGIDGNGKIALGLATLSAAFQCKRWKGNVPPKEVRDFRGAIQGEYEQGIFFTTSDFTDDARKLSIKKGAVPVVLLNGESIVRLMIEKELGVRRVPLYAYYEELDDPTEA